MNLFKLLLAMLFSRSSHGVVETGGGAAEPEEEVEDGEVDEQPGDGAEDKPDGETRPEDEDGEIVVSLGDETPPNEDDDEEAIAAALGDDQLKSAAWARMRVQKKELQRQTRDQAQRLRDLEAKVASATPAETAAVLGPKPKLKEFADADEIAQHEKDTEAWYSRKSEVEAQQAKQTRAAEEENAKWQTRIAAVKQAGAALKVADYPAAEQAFEEIFTPIQQAIVIGGFDDPKTSVLLRYALGRNTKKARELAAIADPVRFTIAIADLRRDMKVTSRKAPPPPDTTVRSGMTGATAVDSQLARLQAEADKTGDRSKVAKYLRDKSKAKQAA
jgi:hypothetical protein